MEKVDEAIVSLQQVNRRTETPMKACHVLTFIMVSLLFKFITLVYL